MVHSFRVVIAIWLACASLTFAQDEHRTAARQPTEEQLRTAQWVEGRVVLPDGAPADERTIVVADAVGLAAFDQHSVNVDANGKFRVAFASNATRGHVRLNGHYVFLEPSALWTAGESTDPIVLRPQLGGRVTGHLKPEGSVASAELQELLAATVEIEGTPLAPGSATVKRTATVGDDFDFEAKALPKGYQWTLTLVAGPFVPCTADVTDVEPGRTKTVDLVLTRGARVRGRVVDENGTGVEGATIDVVSHSDPLAPEPFDCARVKSAADGAFDIRGVAPGDATIWPTREGWISAQQDVTGLTANETRADVKLILRRGHVLTGRVLVPGGKPASGARVRVTQSSLGRADLVREITTQADGAFSFGGLGDEPVDVLATREGVSADAADTKVPGATSRKRILRANAAHVDPATHDLALTLVAGLVIEGRVHDDMGRLVQSYTIGARRIAAKHAPVPADPASMFKSYDVRSADGAFVLDALEPGEWDVYVSGRGIVYAPAQRIRVPYEGDPLVFVVERPAVVSGVVLDAQKKPMGDVVVEAEWDREPLYAGAPTHDRTSVTSSREGRFELTGVYPGRVHLTAKSESSGSSAAVDLVLESGVEKSAVELVLSPKQQ